MPKKRPSRRRNPFELPIGYDPSSRKLGSLTSQTKTVLRRVQASLESGGEQKFFIFADHDLVRKRK